MRDGTQNGTKATEIIYCLVIFFHRLRLKDLGFKLSACTQEFSIDNLFKETRPYTSGSDGIGLQGKPFGPNFFLLAGTKSEANVVKNGLPYLFEYFKRLRSSWTLLGSSSGIIARPCAN